MRSAVSSFIQKLVFEEIRRMVAEAIKSNTTSLSAPACAAEIMKTYPRCGLDEAELANEVMMAAAYAGVPVEFGRQRSASRTPGMGLDTPPKVVVPVKRKRSRAAA